MNGLTPIEENELVYLSTLKQLDPNEVMRLRWLRHAKAYSHQRSEGWEIPSAAEAVLASHGITSDNCYLFSYGWTYDGEFYSGELVTVDRKFFDFEFELLPDGSVDFVEFQESTSNRNLSHHNMGVPKRDDLIVMEVLMSTGRPA